MTDRSPSNGNREKGCISFKFKMDGSTVGSVELTRLELNLIRSLPTNDAVTLILDGNSGIERDDVRLITEMIRAGNWAVKEE